THSIIISVVVIRILHLIHSGPQNFRNATFCLSVSSLETVSASTSATTSIVVSSQTSHLSLLQGSLSFSYTTTSSGSSLDSCSISSFTFILLTNFLFKIGTQRNN